MSDVEEPVDPIDIGATFEKVEDGFNITGITTEKPSYNSKDEEGDKLPKTATSIYNVLLIGLIVLLAGVLLLTVRKRA